jgi:hypothetical protein
MDARGGIALRDRSSSSTLNSQGTDASSPRKSISRARAVLARRFPHVRLIDAARRRPPFIVLENVPVHRPPRRRARHPVHPRRPWSVRISLGIPRVDAASSGCRNDVAEFSWPRRRSTSAGRFCRRRPRRLVIDSFCARLLLGRRSLRPRMGRRRRAAAPGRLGTVHCLPAGLLGSPGRTPDVRDAERLRGFPVTGPRPTTTPRRLDRDSSASPSTLRTGVVTWSVGRGRRSKVVDCAKTSRFRRRRGSIVPYATWCLSALQSAGRLLRFWPSCASRGAALGARATTRFVRRYEGGRCAKAGIRAGARARLSHEDKDIRKKPTCSLDLSSVVH